jgi:hypothetical protein
VLSKARKRWGKEVFVSLFSRVVQQCVEAGLVEGRKIHVDASLVDANAALSSVKPLEPATVSAIEQTAREQLQKPSVPALAAVALFTDIASKNSWTKPVTSPPPRQPNEISNVVNT